MDELAEVREKLYRLKVDTTQVLRANTDAVYLTEHDVECFLSTTFTVGGGVCPECGGKKQYLAKWGTQASWEYCPACKGTGHLPTREVSIREAIEEAKKDGRK